MIYNSIYFKKQCHYYNLLLELTRLYLNCKMTISYSYSVFHFICQVVYTIHAAKALKPFLLAAGLFYELYYKASLVIESDLLTALSKTWNSFFYFTPCCRFEEVPGLVSLSDEVRLNQ